jgi:hypothetical protein
MVDLSAGKCVYRLLFCNLALLIAGLCGRAGHIASALHGFDTYKIGLHVAISACFWRFGAAWLNAGLQHVKLAS